MLEALKSKLCLFQTIGISYHKTGMNLLLSSKAIIIMIDKLYT